MFKSKQFAQVEILSLGEAAQEFVDGIPWSLALNIFTGEEGGS